MNLKEVAKKNGPTATISTIIGLVIGGLGAWTQLQEALPSMFQAEDPYVEFSRHFDEEPVEFMLETDDGTVTLAYYGSDGCFLLDPPGAEARWVTRREFTIDGVQYPYHQVPDVIRAGFIPEPGQTCVTEGCLNPHPGKVVDSWLGSRVEEEGYIWTEVWREFEDGCVHFQMRREDGAWAVEADGRTPRVCWTYCIHGGK